MSSVSCRSHNTETLVDFSIVLYQLHPTPNSSILPNVYLRKACFERFPEYYNSISFSLREFHFSAFSGFNATVTYSTSHVTNCAIVTELVEKYFSTEI